jgi:hypothetical protein
MRNELLTIPIAITTFVSGTSEPISILKHLEIEEVVSDAALRKELAFAPVKTNPFLEIKSKIYSLKQLPNNWDGMGAVTPNIKTINNSLSFLHCLPESAFTNLTKDNIVATPYGTIVFDIEKDDDLVSVEIGDSKIGFFTDFANRSNLPPLEGTSFNQNHLPLELLKALNKLFSLEEAEA